jgi:hypothetical protein
MRFKPLQLSAVLAAMALAMPARADLQGQDAALPVGILKQLAEQVLEGRGCAPYREPTPGEGAVDLKARRYEIAVALKICLDRTAGAPTDAQRRLESELVDELASLNSRLGSLEQDVTQLEATRFAPTTRLRGLSRWYLGGLDYYGNQIGAGNTYLLGIPGGRSGVRLPLPDAITFTYDLQLNLDTSFSGKDLLRTRLRAGNGAYSGFRGNLITPMTRLDGVSPFCSLSNQQDNQCRNNKLLLDKLFYRTPIGSGFTLTFGPRVTQKDMLGLWPSVYGSSERILSLFDYAGAVGAYSDVKGSGFGMYWRQPGRKKNHWVASVAYVASRGSVGELFSAEGRGAATIQLGYLGANWAIAGAYTYNQAGARQDEIITPLSAQTWPTLTKGLGGSVNAFGLSGYVDPIGSGWWPTVSIGWGFNQNNYDLTGPYAASPLLAAQSQSWMIGLEWQDVLDQGNNLGIAIGQPKFLTRFRNNNGDSGAYDTSWALEAWYKIQISDNLAITPAVFWLPRPRGQLTQADTSWNDPILPTSKGASLGVVGIVVKATFKF